jgi:peptidyl-prolyl cis-trans isomerase SurA
MIMNTLRKITLLLLAACIWMPLAFSQTRELGAAGQLLDGVAAVVDSGVVLKSELNQRLQIVIDNLRQSQAELPPEQRRQLPPISVLERQVLDQLVLRQIQLQRAERYGITVSDEMLNRALGSIAQGLGLTLEQLPGALASQGYDYAMYRQDSREQLILEQLEQREVISNIAIAPRELDLCLTQLAANATNELDYNVSHILISLSSSASSEEIDAARRRASEVYTRLQAGDDFAQLAVTYSDAQTALEGGSLGWRKGAQLPTLFADVVVHMKPGEFSEPIQAASGFHIVRLNEVRGAEPVMVDQIHARHILITPTEVLDDAAVEQRLRGLRTEILGGDDFATIARAVSEDIVSAAEGGDLGWVDPGQFAPEFEQQLATLAVGELSQPFRTRYGWHIVEVLEKRTFDTTEDLKQQRCANQIRASKGEEARELWLRRLRDEAYVETLI